MLGLFGVGASGAVWATAGTIILLAVAFVVKFLWPGVLHLLHVRDIADELSKTKTDNQVADFERIFKSDKHLNHIWQEYAESLHKVEEIRDGQTVVVAYRATAPAEMYFHAESFYEGRLHTEFFKHLPGIFTGVGIIGTFTGLIHGLAVFNVSENAASVRTSLKGLMDSVSEAFEISAFAIICAMTATFLEKVLLAALSKKTGEIIRKIDASFEAGVGEEYLSRLVGASEESASQSKILKDALVQDLSQLLRELTDAQITATKEQQAQLAEHIRAMSKEQLEAARQDNQALGETIAESIRKSLEVPMQEIASTVKTASGDQSESAVRMLGDVMSSFSERLNELFGGQISGINALNQQAAANMQDAVQTLRTLVGSMEDANKKSSESMAQQMAESIANMEARQEAMNNQSAAFIEQIRELISSSQSETSQKLQATLGELGDGMAKMLEKFNSTQTHALEANLAREQELAQRTTHAVGSMTESVESIVSELSASTSRMVESVSALTKVTSTTVDQMHAGAAQLGQASRDFSVAGGKVAEVMELAGTVSSKLSEASGALSTGSSAVQEVLRDYQLQRGAVERMVVELRAIVEAARKEASLTADVLNRIDGSAQRLGAAQRQADEYLDGVNSVLADAHESFANEVKRTLELSNSEFHKKLTSAVSMLHSTVQELEATLGTIGALTPKRA